MKTDKKKETSWARINLQSLLLGIFIGCCVYLFNCALKGELVNYKNLIVSILFGVTISMSITNIIYFAHKTKILQWEKVWLSFPLYYLFSYVGMLIGVELTYLLMSLTFGWENKFPHVKDYPFDAIIVLIVCTIIFVNSYRKALARNKLQEKELELQRANELKSRAELDVLQAKVNPHFLYNALNAVAGLIKEEPSRAERMTINLSKLFRHSMNYKQEILVPLKEEIELLNTYLEIEKERFGDRIDFSIKIEHALEEAAIPRFLLQPLVENALKHGLHAHPQGAALKINIYSVSGFLCIEVADNGIPFPDDLQVGYGLQSTNDKLDLLYKGRATVELLNKPEKMVQIKIPLA